MKPTGPDSRTSSSAALPAAQVDAADPVLKGEVDAGVTMGTIRYRSWPTQRHPIRSTLIGIALAVAIVTAWYAFDSLYDALIVGMGLAVGATLLLFPTDVALDSHTLHLRQMGFLRTYDLRRFRRLEVAVQPVPRVELGMRAKLSPTDTVRGVVLPLPAQKDASEDVLTHLRRWVGRRPTGRFELDDDHVPSDSVS